MRIDGCPADSFHPPSSIIRQILSRPKQRPLSSATMSVWSSARGAILAAPLYSALAVMFTLALLALALVRAAQHSAA